MTPSAHLPGSRPPLRAPILYGKRVVSDSRKDPPRAPGRRRTQRRGHWLKSFAATRAAGVIGAWSGCEDHRSLAGAGAGAGRWCDRGLPISRSGPVPPAARRRSRGSPRRSGGPHRTNRREVIAYAEARSASATSGRHRPGHLRLLRAGHDGLSRRRDDHPPYQPAALGGIDVSRSLDLA